MRGLQADWNEGSSYAGWPGRSLCQRATPWYQEYVKQYGEGPDIRLPSDDPLKGPQYDYRNAWFRDVRPIRDPEDGQLHWPSSAGGQMLKSGSHPTFWKEGFMRRYGVNPDSLRDEDLISQYGWYRRGPLVQGLMRPDEPPQPGPLRLGDWTGRLTTEGRKIYNNNFGGFSSEYTIGVKHPSINNGELTHIPSIYGGKVLRDPIDAINMIARNGGKDPETGRFITPGGDPGKRSSGLDNSRGQR